MTDANDPEDWYEEGLEHADSWTVVPTGPSGPSGPTAPPAQTTEQVDAVRERHDRLRAAGYAEAVYQVVPAGVGLSVPSARRIMDVVDFHVSVFAARDDIDLDLLGVTQAWVHLLRHSAALATTAMRVTYEREALSPDDWPRPMSEIVETYGSYLEDVMTDHASMVLSLWYGARKYLRDQ
ncbi:hypothetical protein ABFT23_02115 [Nocardioides sp. C4-1]|uniref:hypothetical protein n=1 Tax=Nocardioides sp. C4-1 TaxID=3151851 RepID=UPI003265DA66